VPFSCTDSVPRRAGQRRVLDAAPGVSGSGAAAIDRNHPRREYVELLIGANRDSCQSVTVINGRHDHDLRQ
jgi:hypothetical protein